ncbi:DUF1178 family protein [Oxalicibacterium faecigallinarum]|uniref:DUF1178 family protein n=1 Tax=Oxalicibacterium faecigallinarum TaxID=573741 RepID=UPI00166AD0F7|nr:DUF1178 family protein [Oxalicibacterium faecigallinarum]
MKVYDLQCAQDHRFEGWFASEEDFLSQNERHLIDCPMCGNQQVNRLPSSPRLNLSGATKATSSENRRLQEKLQDELLSAARAIIANTEDVGDAFAEEARRIHYNESEERGIRGITTAAERMALADEGIDVFSLPVADVVKQTLQ